MARDEEQSLKQSSFTNKNKIKEDTSEIGVSLCQIKSVNENYKYNQYMRYTKLNVLDTLFVSHF